MILTNTTKTSDPRTTRIWRGTKVFWMGIAPLPLGYLHVAGDVPIAPDYTRRFSCWLPLQQSRLAPAFPVSNSPVSGPNIEMAWAFLYSFSFFVIHFFKIVFFNFQLEQSIIYPITLLKIISSLIIGYYI